MSDGPRPLPRGYVGELVAAFTELELALATCAALLLQVLFLAVLVAITNQGRVKEQSEVVNKPVPIAVRPVLDEMPLLKLGGKKVRPKLPDLWQKNPPVRRVKAASAPSPHAEDDVKKIPDTPVAKRDAGAPPPDAEVAKEVDELQPDASAADAQTTALGEGSPDGVKEGTEADPLKARALSQYRMKILAWFNARFSPPGEGAPCEELKKLRAGVAVQIGSDRNVAGYALTRPSGNAVFDAKVKATMDAIVGQQLPPPPPLYPDILDTAVYPTFSGANAPCQ